MCIRDSKYIVYNSFFLLFSLLLPSCGGDNIEDLINENDLTSYYEDIGRVDITINGQKIEEPLVGFLFAHPTISETFGNTVILSTWPPETILQALTGVATDGKKLEAFSIIIGQEYEGVGKYSLANIDNLVCYSISFYDKQNDDVIEGEEFCSDTIANNNSDRFIEITTDENGRFKGNFSANIKSEATGEELQIEGIFDIKLEE